MTQLRTLRKLYQGLQSCEYDRSPTLEILIEHNFWSLKKVCRAFEKYIGVKGKPRRINPSPYDTLNYYSMKPSEQGSTEGRFMNEVLTGKRII